MNKVLNQIIRNLLSAVVAGVCFALLTYWDNGEVDFLVVLASTLLSFVLSCLLCLIAPPLRRLTGHDKKAEDAWNDSREDSNEGNSKE